MGSIWRLTDVRKGNRERLMVERMNINSWCSQTLLFPRSVPAVKVVSLSSQESGLYHNDGCLLDWVLP